MNMKITPFISNNNIYSQKSEKNSPAFGTTHRYYKNANGEFGTNTWPFRDDIDWKALSEYEKKHFKNTQKVNLVQFASSDGSEAYTQIISLIENNPSADDKKFFPIKAFDIDPEVVKAAQSRLLNTMTFDRVSLQMNTENYDKYFKETGKKLDIKDDIKFDSVKTLEVSKILTDKVVFENADMYKSLALREIEIATALQPAESMEENSVEVVIDTYKKLDMQKEAQVFLDKIEQLTDPAIDFILKMEKIINE